MKRLSEFGNVISTACLVFATTIATVCLVVAANNAQAATPIEIRADFELSEAKADELKSMAEKADANALFWQWLYKFKQRNFGESEESILKLFPRTPQLDPYLQFLLARGFETGSAGLVKRSSLAAQVYADLIEGVVKTPDKKPMSQFSFEFIGLLSKVDTEGLSPNPSALKEAASKRLIELAAGGGFAEFVFADLAFDDKITGADREKALEIIIKHAKEGEPRAEVRLGMIYLTGSGGVTRNLGAGLGWLKSAARHGSVLGFATLADIYSQGTGVSENKIEAMQWFSLAATVEPELFENQKQEYSKTLTSGQVRVAEIKAKIFAKQYLKTQPQKPAIFINPEAPPGETTVVTTPSIPSPEAHAIYKLGLGHADGYKYYYPYFKDTPAPGFPRNYRTAYSYFLQAANMGHADSMAWVASLLSSGDGTGQVDCPAGVEWYKKSAAAGSATGLYRYGRILDTGGLGGTITPKNLEAAIPYYKKAAELGHPTAIARLKELGR